jgi:hypothetical protein
VTHEAPDAAPTLLVRATNAALTLTASAIGREAPASAMALRAFAPRHEVSTTGPALLTAALSSDYFDPLTLVASATLGPPADGHQIVRIELVGRQSHGSTRAHLFADLGIERSIPAVISWSADRFDATRRALALAPRLDALLGARRRDDARHAPVLTASTNGEATFHFTIADALDAAPTLRSLRQDGTLAIGPGTLETSRLVDGYMKGLADLGVKDALVREVGTPVDFDAITGTFHIAQGRVTIPRLDIHSPRLSLWVSGSYTFDGESHFAVHSDTSHLGPELAKVLRGVDDAGGIIIEGVKGGADKVSIPSDFLRRAAESVKKVAEKGNESVEEAVKDGQKKLEEVLGGEKKVKEKR